MDPFEEKSVSDSNKQGCISPNHKTLITLTLTSLNVHIHHLKKMKNNSLDMLIVPRVETKMFYNINLGIWWIRLHLSGFVFTMNIHNSNPVYIIEINFSACITVRNTILGQQQLRKNISHI